MAVNVGLSVSEAVREIKGIVDIWRRGGQGVGYALADELRMLANQLDPPKCQQDDVDWLVAEAEFVADWNRLEGVARSISNAIPASSRLAFQQNYLTPGWRDHVAEAMRKFPLPCGVTMGLRKFLTDGVIDDILGGVYDFEPRGRAAGSANQAAFDEVFGRAAG